MGTESVIIRAKQAGWSPDLPGRPAGRLSGRLTTALNGAAMHISGW